MTSTTSAAPDGPRGLADAHEVEQPAVGPVAVRDGDESHAARRWRASTADVQSSSSGRGTVTTSAPQRGGVRAPGVDVGRELAGEHERSRRPAAAAGCASPARRRSDTAGTIAMPSASPPISRAAASRNASEPLKKSCGEISHGRALAAGRPRPPRRRRAAAGPMYAALRYATSSGMSKRSRWLGRGCHGAEDRTLRSPSCPAPYETELRPRSPFDLARSARFQGCGTRTFRDGVLRVAFRAGGEPARAVVTQRADGAPARRVSRRPTWTRPSITSASRSAPTTTSRPSSSAPATTRCSGASCDGRAACASAAAVERGARRAAGDGRPADHVQRGAAHRARRDRDDDAARPRPPPAAVDGRPRGARRPPGSSALGLAGRRAAALVRVCRTLELERLHEHPTTRSS